MKISIIVEGKTESGFKVALQRFLLCRLGSIPLQLDFRRCNGRIPTGDKLKRDVFRLLSGRAPSDHVLALTDVYTGSKEFKDAADAKAKMREWVGPEPRFHPHAAQHDFEAWLLPYWETIKILAGCDLACPKGNPENVNHDKPPSRRVEEAFRTGTKQGKYKKGIDSQKILDKNDLSVAIAKCPELRAFVNTILEICGGERV